MPNHGAGGRPKGTRNKRSQGLLAEIKRQFPNYDPIMHMASVAADESNDVATRLAASKDIAQYVYPKLKAVEMHVDGKVALAAAQITDEEWAALAFLQHGRQPDDVGSG